MYHNNKDQTAEELFYHHEHNELLKSVQEWIKETAESCSTVAVLVATVDFATAHAILGVITKVSVLFSITILYFCSSHAWTLWPSPARCLLWLSFSLPSPLHPSTRFSAAAFLARS
ncbi:hypothetical protein D8674_028091 [Pyrus ussuriensis x Pyrus communis]|uniref:Uncharacterized protein n=1 Tax=Pyrus ussuriensis x Pyrus communis TaxID=2448454 RepID=A0A5N5IE77_9ROSA|nr:hypothetical protein D8674_028091 [Pyrus ussuriensis x Pyrus communis]